ncbi:MAG: T9SS type A sorting domain-containing protein, partial [Elusimicrobiota bacterium]|nr:T9SS type A sorting domain-containing protein [Endomicrobiia bacterium]MDW8165089.1 T9SS type A sorting domain-containing protein [Elusimicrobiota bacterium]
NWNTLEYSNATYFIKIIAYDNNSQSGYLQIEVIVYNPPSQNQNDGGQSTDQNIYKNRHNILSSTQPSIDFSSLVSDNILKVEIFDIKGKILKVIEESPFLLSLNDKLNLGFYIYKITTTDNQKLFGTINVIK